MENIEKVAKLLNAKGNYIPSSLYKEVLTTYFKARFKDYRAGIV